MHSHKWWWYGKNLRHHWLCSTAPLQTTSCRMLPCPPTTFQFGRLISLRCFYIWLFNCFVLSWSFTWRIWPRCSAEGCWLGRWRCWTRREPAPAFPANTALSWFSSCGTESLTLPCRSRIKENYILGFFSCYLLSLPTSTTSHPSDKWCREVFALARDAQEALLHSSTSKPVPWIYRRFGGLQAAVTGASCLNHWGFTRLSKLRLRGSPRNPVSQL